MAAKAAKIELRSCGSSRASAAETHREWPDRLIVQAGYQNSERADDNQNCKAESKLREAIAHEGGERAECH